MKYLSIPATTQLHTHQAMRIVRSVAIAIACHCITALANPQIPFDGNYTEIIVPDTEVNIGQIVDINHEIKPKLVELVNTDFFKYYKLNLWKPCPFWNGDEGFCKYKDCSVDFITDWSQVPDIWQPDQLGKLGDNTVHKDKGQDENELSSNDYCALDKDDDEDLVYVNLIDNPERFTGYGGQQSESIWTAVYDENCFQPNEGSQLGQVEDLCLEKQIFYRLVSGLHSSISTHLTNEYLNLKNGAYEPNLKQFMIKVGYFTERIQNLHLNYVLVLKSLIKLQEYNVIDNLPLDDSLKAGLSGLISQGAQGINQSSDDYLFNEKVLFQNDQNDDLKNEFRDKFRNVTRLMDCVHCERCKLWGKLQTTGYGTALKILFDLKNPNDSINLKRVELVALVNTFHRLSKSVESIENFEKLYKIQPPTQDRASASSESLGLFDNEDEQNLLNSFSVDQAVISSKEAPEEIKSKPVGKAAYKQNSCPSLGSKSIKEAFHEELHAFIDAIGFILNSYRTLPKLLYTLFLVKSSELWDIFIGTQRHRDTTYRVDL